MVTGSLSAPDPRPASAELAAASQCRPGPQAANTPANHDGPAARARHSDGTPGPVLNSPLRLGAPGVAGTPGAYSPLTRHKLGVFATRHSLWDGPDGGEGGGGGTSRDT